MTIQDRLRKYLEAKRWTYKDLETRCKFGNGTAANLSEKTRQQTLRRIELNTDLNVDWLLTGKGDMINPNATPTQTNGFNSADRDEVRIEASAWRVIQQQAESLARRDDQIDRMINLLQTVVSGQPTPQGVNSVSEDVAAG